MTRISEDGTLNFTGKHRLPPDYEKAIDANIDVKLDRIIPWKAVTDREVSVGYLVFFGTYEEFKNFDLYDKVIRSVMVTEEDHAKIVDYKYIQEAYSKPTEAHNEQER